LIPTDPQYWYDEHERVRKDRDQWKEKCEALRRAKGYAANRPKDRWDLDDKSKQIVAAITKVEMFNQSMIGFVYWFLVQIGIDRLSLNIITHPFFKGSVTVISMAICMAVYKAWQRFD
jgi:hypothetical protein